MAATLTKNNSTFLLPQPLSPIFLLQAWKLIVFSKNGHKNIPHPTCSCTIWLCHLPIRSLFLNLLLNFDRCWVWFDPKNTSKMTAQLPGFPWTILTAFALWYVEARHHVKVCLAFCEKPKPPGEALEDEASRGKRKRPRPLRCVSAGAIWEVDPAWWHVRQRRQPSQTHPTFLTHKIKNEAKQLF